MAGVISFNLFPFVFFFCVAVFFGLVGAVIKTWPEPKLRRLITEDTKEYRWPMRDPSEAPTEEIRCP